MCVGVDDGYLSSTSACMQFFIRDIRPQALTRGRVCAAAGRPMRNLLVIGGSGRRRLHALQQHQQRRWWWRRRLFVKRWFCGGLVGGE